MPSTSPSLLRAAAAALTLGAVADAADAGDHAASFASPVAWSSVRLEASKLLMSIDVDMRLELMDATAASAMLVENDGLVSLPAPDSTLLMGYTSDGMGRESDVTMLLDPATGAMLQRTTVDRGNRYRVRLYRYGDDRVLRRTQRPEDGEEQRDPDAWSRQSDEIRPFAADRPALAVTEPAALIYLASASGLAAQGDAFELLAWSDDELYLVTTRVLGEESIKRDLRLTADGATREVDGKVRALRLEIRGRPLDLPEGAGDDGNFELLGLRDLELYLDPDSRAPLRLTGRLPRLGRVTFNASRIGLTDTGS